MIKINVILNNIIWKKYLKNPYNFIDKKIESLNKKNKLYKKNTLLCSLLLSGTTEIKKLNRKFRKKNKSTDVLSFPFYEKKQLNNNNIKYLALNISGKEKYCLWDIFNKFCQYRNKKAIKINLGFLDSILPFFLKKYFKSNRTLQNLLPIARYSDNFNDGDNITL